MRTILTLAAAGLAVAVSAQQLARTSATANASAMRKAPQEFGAHSLPQASPLGKVEQVVGLTNVSVEYSRPSAKGRKVFGDVVPYGVFWRTGANASTKITFDDMAIIGGQKVKPGTYSLLTFPNEGAWLVVLNSDSDVNNADAYDESKNVATIKVEPKRTEFTETFTISFGNVVNDAATLDLAWENTKVSIPLEAPSTEQALRNIDTMLAGREIKPAHLHMAARFCVDRNVRLKEALEWATRSVKEDPKFWSVHTLALLQAANGDTKAAIATAQRSLEMAKEAKADAYVKLNEAKIAEWSGKK
jgi:hypothetical protein